MSSRKSGRPENRENAARRRKQILEASARLFAERGYPGTRIEDVAASIQVGKGTIYRYFSTKEELFQAAVDWGMRGLQERIDGEADGVSDPLEKIRHVPLAYLAFFDEHPEMVELFIQERARSQSSEPLTYFRYKDAESARWREIFLQLVRDKVLRDVPVDGMMDVMANLLYGTIFTNHFAGRKKSWALQAQEVLDIIFHGILKKK